MEVLKISRAQVFMSRECQDIKGSSPFFYHKCLLSFSKNLKGHIFIWGHWYPCHRFLVTPAWVSQLEWILSLSCFIACTHGFFRFASGAISPWRPVYYQTHPSVIFGKACRAFILNQFKYYTLIMKISVAQH